MPKSICLSIHAFETLIPNHNNSSLISVFLILSLYFVIEFFMRPYGGEFLSPYPTRARVRAPYTTSTSERTVRVEGVGEGLPASPISRGCIYKNY
jgi:hypothetical protein